MPLSTLRMRSCSDAGSGTYCSVRYCCSDVRSTSCLAWVVATSSRAFFSLEKKVPRSSV